jgi:chemotaxis signal transduction protein
VLDLGSALGRPHEGIADRKRVLALASGEQAAFGILIDAIDDVMELPLADIRPLPTREEAAITLLRGVTSDAVLVLDADALIRTYE